MPADSHHVRPTPERQRPHIGTASSLFSLALNGVAKIVSAGSMHSQQTCGRISSPGRNSSHWGTVPSAPRFTGASISSPVAGSSCLVSAGGVPGGNKGGRG